MRLYRLKMKNIGLVTFHASHNYGSVLQAYALQKKLTAEGYNVKIINYRSEKQKACYPVKRKYKGVKGALRNAYQWLIGGALQRRYDEFERFINEVLPVTEEVNDEKELARFADSFDAYVCGSDQIWNPACQDFSKAYYLDFVRSKRKIAYAPSMGKAEFDEENAALIQYLLAPIDYISVREEQGSRFLSKLTDKPVRTVCDPVVLLDKKYWEEAAIMPKLGEPYLLCYFLDNNHGDREYLDLIAKTLRLKVVVLNERIKDVFKFGYQKAYGASPFEFVGLIKNASFVYTNSFHATAFSTIFNVPFASMIAQSDNVHNNNDSRKIDFLRSVGLEKNCKKFLSAEEIRNLSEMDFSKANESLGVMQQAGNEYLLGALEDE